MNIVARLVSILLCLSAWLGSGLRAQQNPTATGECCPPRAVVIDSSVDAQVMADGVFTLVLDQVGLLSTVPKCPRC